MKKKIIFKNKKKSQKKFKFIPQQNKINNINIKNSYFNTKKIKVINFVSIKNNFFSFDIQKESVFRKKVWSIIKKKNINFFTKKKIIFLAIKVI